MRTRRTGPARSIRIGLLICALLGPAFVPASNGQETEVAKATRIKAAYLYKFTKFVKWPGENSRDAGSPIVIGLVGEDPFGPILDATVADKRVRGRRIEIKRFEQRDEELPSREALEACHIAFVSSSHENRLEALIDSLRDASVLTVSDVNRFAVRGGMIELAPEDDRIIFKVNREATKRADLRLAAKLLRFAEIVETEKPE